MRINYTHHLLYFLHVHNIIFLHALVPNWSPSHPAAFDLKAIHPVHTDLILEASLASSTHVTLWNVSRLESNPKMIQWMRIPLVVEVCAGRGMLNTQIEQETCHI